MFELVVNGKKVTADQDKKLMAFLRDDLRLTSVKDGCSEGACGACSVIIDGKAMRACVPTVAKSVGKTVITTEGLSQREKDVYAYAFGKCGAVQCGFCIPGMVMSAKALIDQNNNPTIDDVKKAIRPNICRCTGYKKIEEAILLAAELLRENKEIPAENHSGKMGDDLPRIDADEKTLGTGIYVDDMVLPGMLYGRALRSKFPHAVVKKIDRSKALAHSDVVAVLLREDIPGNYQTGHLIRDWDVLIGEGMETRYVGDSVALVITKTKEALPEAMALVEVEYEELKPICNPMEAMAEGAHKIHESGNILKHEVLKRGNVEEAFANAAHIVTNHFSVPFTEHAFMEPECAISVPEEDGVLIYTASQNIYDDQRECSEMLGLPAEKVHVISKYVGGGFGGKEDMSVQHHAALAAYVLKKPVKIKQTRQDSLNCHPKRHPMEMDFSVACDKEGNLLGMKAVIVADTGAYASLGGPVLQRACTHAGGPYNFKNIEVDGKAVYTNNPPSGAFRGFGVTQSAFAMEASLNLLAEKVGISAWDIRYKNAIRPGQSLPNGQIADNSTALEECLLAVKDVFEANPTAGIATSFKNSGVGVGLSDTSRAILSIEKGKIHIRTAAACIGQGMATVSLQMACQQLNLTPDHFIVEAPDTKRTPDAGTTTASRQTVMTGESVRRACALLKEEMDKGLTLADLEGKEFYAEFDPPTDKMGSDKPNPVSHVAYGYAAQVVILDTEGKVDRVVAAYDVGHVVNPRACEGQIEGGVVMGLGYGLTEDYIVENGYPKSKYGTLGVWRAPEVPPIDVIIVDRAFEPEYAFGGKGVGELATIPTAPAIQHAYYRMDGEFRTQLPLENTFYRKKK